jgi:hypothetical protein
MLTQISSLCSTMHALASSGLLAAHAAAPLQAAVAAVLTFFFCETVVAVLGNERCCFGELVSSLAAIRGLNLLA